MDGNDATSDQVVAELVDMGFDMIDVTKAIKTVGPSLDNAVEFILSGSNRNDRSASTSLMCPGGNKVTGKRTTSSLQTSDNLRQQYITKHLKFASRPEQSNRRGLFNTSVTNIHLSTRVDEPDVSLTVDTHSNLCQDMNMVPSHCEDEKIIEFDWEKKVNNLLQKNFGYSTLKSFQKEAIGAWLANQDCLVLAATGSGKSLCFQIPALLSGKVVVVVSPLISLMHDQCLKLGKHGISACFLGSGQTDKSVENKAMNGAYSIIYVCPETILRLIKPLQSLAESRGIALFAIDEVHCVSKWGHDFRPDYRRLSILRQSFRGENLKCVKFDIPLMALTATATIRVREDVLKSLCMSTDAAIVTTSFFRPNLRFSVKHSRTSASSYEKDFSELITLYTKNKISSRKLTPNNFEDSLKNTSYSPSGIGIDEMCRNVDNCDDYEFLDGDGCLDTPEEEELSVQYLEDDYDRVQGVDDLDVSCGESCGWTSLNSISCGTADSNNLMSKSGKSPAIHQRYLEEGPTLIYVPTRKETLSITKFLSTSGIKAAAYNAKLPKSHLRKVHKEFHADELQVVVATIAFGMGIDKLNVRRIIHYGWPQSLEAYYQEAGRAGRDGELADCVLYANLSRLPTLLPSQRSKEQTKQTYQMLSDCFRYGMNTSCCRAKVLVEYFGEEFSKGRCDLCDVCTNGPPEIQDLEVEAMLLLQLIGTHYESKTCQGELSNDDVIHSSNTRMLREFVSMIREQNEKFAASDFIWWRGLARILEDKGFIREGDEMTHVQIKIPEPTESGLQFLKSKSKQPFLVYPEADMVLSTSKCRSYSSFSEWGKGWADPVIRRQRLQGKERTGRKRNGRKKQFNLSTVRGRLSAKLKK